MDAVDSEVEMTYQGTIRSRLRDFRLVIALVGLGVVGAVTVGIITSDGGLAFAGTADEPDEGDAPVATGAPDPGHSPGSEQPGAQEQDGQQPDGQQPDGGDSAGAAHQQDQAAAPVGAPTVECPIVAGALPQIPDAAVDEVLRDLDALQSQIAAANQRLVTSQGEGGPNFARNAVLGPLADKRAATLERIEIAIGRHAERPALQGLAECGLNEGTGA